MTEILEAIILGIVQGLTEFLPVSSSGHLEIFKFLLNDDSYAEQSMLTTIFLHFATALATIYIFRDDVLKILKALFDRKKSDDKRFAYFIILSMIPAVLVGLFFDDIAESLFNQNLVLVGICLLITAFLLWISEKIIIARKPLNAKSAFVIGIAQAIAILPGISRSGATLATSLLMGVDKERAARFSFLMVVPIIFGKICKDLLTGDFGAYMPEPLYLLAGFIAAFISGAWACKIMISIVQQSKLHWFSIYCVIIGIAAIYIGLEI